jgi:rubrerythrin
MDPLTLIAIWTTVVLAAIGGLSIHGEFRRRRIGADVSEDRVFRCGQCTAVYTDDENVERSRCPQCGKTNEAFRF